MARTKVIKSFVVGDRVWFVPYGDTPPVKATIVQKFGHSYYTVETDTPIALYGGQPTTKTDANIHNLWMLDDPAASLYVEVHTKHQVMTKAKAADIASAVAPVNALWDPKIKEVQQALYAAQQIAWRSHPSNAGRRVKVG